MTYRSGFASSVFKDDPGTSGLLDPGYAVVISVTIPIR